MHTFPEDAVTSNGASFWSAPKRFPQPLKFTPTDKGQVALCRAAAILKAQTFGIAVPAWAASLEKVLHCSLARVVHSEEAAYVLSSSHMSGGQQLCSGSCIGLAPNLSKFC